MDEIIKKQLDRLQEMKTFFEKLNTEEYKLEDGKVVIPKGSCENIIKMQNEGIEYLNQTLS